MKMSGESHPYPRKQQQVKNLYNNANPADWSPGIGNWFAYRPATTSGRGFTLEVPVGKQRRQRRRRSVTYQEAGLFMGEGPSFSDMFARTVFPAIAKNSSRSMTSKWTIRWT